MKNNKVYILILLSSFLSTGLFGQYFNGGVLFGVTASQVDGDNFSGYHQPGLTGGFFANRKLSSNSFGQIEIVYVAKGARNTGTKNDPMVYHQKLRYIEVPFKYCYLPAKLDFSFETGVGFAYLFNDEGDFNGVPINYNKDPLKKVDISWLLGGNYIFNDKVTLSLQYSYSFLPIRDVENPGVYYGALARAISFTKGDYNNVIKFIMYYALGK